ncbi:MAG: hypothetical protein AAB345_05090 [Patescibacteria group bacterium]
MEKVPSPESLPIDRGVVSNLLKEGGFEDLEAKTLLNKWLDENQRKVEQGVISNLEFNISWAELYRDAGMNSEASEAFKQAAELSLQENNEEECRGLREEADKLNS